MAYIILTYLLTSSSSAS